MAMRCKERVPLHKVKLYGWTWGWKLQGQAGPLEVRITTRIDKETSQVVAVIPGPPGFSEVSIRREDQTPWKTREIEVGSESFDDMFFVEGPVGFVLALLDAKTRGLMLRVNDALTAAGSRLEIVGGELLAETVDDHVPLILPHLLSVGERLAQPVNVKQRLAQNATEDPEVGVRLKSLLHLVRELPGDEGTLKVLRDACMDRSPEVRLRAARALGAEGRGVLQALAEKLENDDVSAEAVSILDCELPPFENKQVVLLRALRSSSLQTARACLEALGRGGDAASAVNLLVEVMEQQGEVAVFAARAMATTGSPAAEEPLIRALQGNQADLRVAAANALGRIGSTSAVLPLKKRPSVSRATSSSAEPHAKRSPRSNPASQAPRPASSRWPGRKRASCRWRRPTRANCRWLPTRRASFRSSRRSEDSFRSAIPKKAEDSAYRSFRRGQSKAVPGALMRRRGSATVILGSRVLDRKGGGR